MFWVELVVPRFCLSSELILSSRCLFILNSGSACDFLANRWPRICSFRLAQAMTIAVGRSSSAPWLSNISTISIESCLVASASGELVNISSFSGSSSIGRAIIFGSAPCFKSKATTSVYPPRTAAKSGVSRGAPHSWFSSSGHRSISPLTSINSWVPSRTKYNRSIIVWMPSETRRFDGDVFRVEGVLYEKHIWNTNNLKNCSHFLTVVSSECTSVFVKATFQFRSRFTSAVLPSRQTTYNGFWPVTSWRLGSNGRRHSHVPESYLNNIYI